MKSKSILVVVIGALACVNINAVANITVTSDFLIRDGDVYDSLNQIFIYDTEPDITTVTMTGGDVYALVPYESSIANVSGGYVDYIVPYDSATVDMSGGGTYNIRSYNTSKVNFRGGDVSYLAAFDSSIINLTGGVIDHLSGYDSSIINIFGTDFFVSETGGYITGNWLDGTPFNISIFNHPAYGDDTISHVHFNPAVIPAPPAILLGSIGVGFVSWLRRRRTL
jgi:hypothetical protein